MRDFGEILEENRKKKGYSQSDLVDLLSQEGIQDVYKRQVLYMIIISLVNNSNYYYYHT